jgi:hypothetical protein
MRGLFHDEERNFQRAIVSPETNAVSGGIVAAATPGKFIMPPLRDQLTNTMYTLAAFRPNELAWRSRRA